MKEIYATLATHGYEIKKINKEAGPTMITEAEVSVFNAHEIKPADGEW